VTGKEGGAASASGGQRGLRRELRFWEAIALSIGIMAPGAAMALNGTLPASLVGQAVPLVFVFAAVGVVFVAYGFVRLTQHFSHAGSVYAFSGATLGPRAGFFSGWALFGTYLGFTAGSTGEIGLFIGEFLDGVGVGRVDWLPIALVALVLVGLLAYGDVRVATRALLAFEVVTVALIAVLVTMIFVRILAGEAPRGQGFTLDVFTPNGVTFSALALATVFGFLSFAGFEGAAALGEETDEPSRTIPLAIRRAILFAGVFYVVTMLAQTLGFGTDAAGVGAFAEASSPLGRLGEDYVASSFAHVINLGVGISAFASALGTATAGSRILYALCRDGFLTPRLGVTSARFGSPANALVVVLAVALVTLVGLRLNGTSAVNAFFYPGTMAVLSLIVAYAVTNAGALRFLFLGRRAPLWEVVFPVGALLFLGFVLYKNLRPVPPYPYNVFPYLVAAWLAVGLAIVVLVPGLARKIGASLAAEQGIESTPPAAAARAE
jgi:amino acid transporter